MLATDRQQHAQVGFGQSTSVNVDIHKCIDTLGSEDAKLASDSWQFFCVQLAADLAECQAKLDQRPEAEWRGKMICELIRLI
jgi:hypothetical protein